MCSPPPGPRDRVHPKHHIHPVTVTLAPSPVESLLAPCGGPVSTACSSRKPSADPQSPVWSVEGPGSPPTQPLTPLLVTTVQRIQAGHADTQTSTRCGGQLPFSLRSHQETRVASMYLQFFRRKVIIQPLKFGILPKHQIKIGKHVTHDQKLKLYCI